MIDGDCSGRRRSKKRKSSTGNARNALTPSRVVDNDGRNSNSVFNNNSSESINAPSTTSQAYLNWFLQQTEETTLHNAIERIIYFGAGISSWLKLDA